VSRILLGAGSTWALGLALAGWQASPTDPAKLRQQRVDETCELARSPRAATGSRGCLLCHDGTLTHAALPGPRLAGELLANHPVGVDYEAARASDRWLRPSAQLPREMPLVNGRIECTTCHDARSSEPMKTALPMTRSRLCFACHDL